MGFAGLEIARSGMHVNERALSVTGHNISNVNTKGYARQQAMITTGPYQNCVNYQLGLGASIQETRQIRHLFLDNIYRNENTSFGYWETRSKTFQEVQTILGDPMGDGLQNVLNQFWDSWQELSKEPDSLTVRALVRQRAEALVHQINHLGSQLDKLQEDLNQEILVRIKEINIITSQIADLNVKIMQEEVCGDNANDYRDQRNLLLDNLSKIANFEFTEKQNGDVEVTLGGYFLVSKGEHMNLVAGKSATNKMFYVPQIEGMDIEIPIRGGILKGLMESRGDVSGSIEGITDPTSTAVASSVNIVSDLKMRLNVLVNSLVTQVNDLHKSGKTLGVPPSDGEDFFTAINPAYPLEMGNIKLNDNLVDLDNIVASQSGASGDNTIALAIANLRDVRAITDTSGVVSLDDYYQTIILIVGTGGSEAERTAENQKTLVASADSQRQSIMGVSMDEEMSYMMKYKFAYSASSRTMNVIDDMLETIITKMGLVGR
ncbi:flagellar hook-associated protein FlgK [Acetivibrio mesophilus]|uniref:Flagellar hook-associated protein 1 n=1 Tax=Acetivibrio mesophilus TaxID=2487273 RepID=A0A4Q0I3Q8_9FIRM|nr:flagellar hook-associated protein FlgK [Acetivibrio mesophilus]RXE58841.1 flagellar hook-associated protein FlgK [Acetivibrio mesophilus]HHV29564.1 flagellar hook-associated protein FlgK [Clostridium sp.]